MPIIALGEEIKFKDVLLHRQGGLVWGQHGEDPRADRPEGHEQRAHAGRWAGPGQHGLVRGWPTPRRLNLQGGRGGTLLPVGRKFCKIPFKRAKPRNFVGPQAPYFGLKWLKRGRIFWVKTKDSIRIELFFRIWQINSDSYGSGSTYIGYRQICSYFFVTPQVPYSKSQLQIDACIWWVFSLYMAG